MAAWISAGGESQRAGLDSEAFVELIGMWGARADK